VADELGTAVLRIVADDSAARESLNVLRRDVEQLTTRATRTVAPAEVAVQPPATSHVKTYAASTYEA
jgi:hypothetical protein